MKEKRLTGSVADVYVKCQHVMQVDWDEEASDALFGSTDKRDIGNAVDAILSAHLEVGESFWQTSDETIAAHTANLSPENRQIVRDMIAQYRKWAGDKPKPHWKPQVRLAYNPETEGGRLLKAADKHRDYTDALPHEIPMTIDVMGVDTSNGRVLDIIDWKTGSIRHEAIEYSMQVGLAALAGVAALGSEGFPFDAVRVRYVYLRKTRVTVKEAELTPFDLETHKKLMRTRLQVVDDNPRTGFHCFACPGVGTCDAGKTFAVRQMTKNEAA